MGYTPKSFTRNAVKILKTPNIVKPDDPLRRQFIKFVNTLRCPICQSGLDGSIDCQASLFCRTNPKEYQVDYTIGYKVPDRDCIRIQANSFLYEIKHLHLGYNIFISEIYRVAEEYWKYPTEKRGSTILEHQGEIIFGASSFNKEEFLKKMELYDVFS